MKRRKTIQKDLVRDAVSQLHDHPSANEVYEFIHKDHPSIGKGTVYRNLNILSQENAIHKVEIPNGSDRFDYRLGKHYHVKCIECSQIFDVDMNEIPNLEKHIHDTHGIQFLDYDILFRGICPACRQRIKKEDE